MNIQGQDGTPFLSYYDRHHALSFVWDGTQNLWIDVSFGGSGEPVIARIPWEIRLGNEGNVSDGLLTAFRTVCEAFVERLHAIEAVEPQAHGRD